MKFAERVEDRALFATSRLLTELRIAEHDGTCRVCGKPFARGDTVRSRQWHLEHAHEGCGWLREDEHAVHERRRPGTFFAYYEWRCPTCGLDACAQRAPRDGDPLACRRCRPAPAIAVDVTVETAERLAYRVGRGRRPRRVDVPAFTRARIVKLSGELALVRWETPIDLESWARLDVLRSI